MRGLKIVKKQADQNDELRQKAKRWDNVKTDYRQNEDGTRSSHKMAYATVDDGAIAYPTVFPKDPKGTKSHDPKDWIELDHKAAQDTAKSRGEVYFFKNEDNAKKWSEGEYKKN
jgi:YHS domain-containing protein